MARSSDPVNGRGGRELDAHAYQVVYLVKRPTYEFRLAIPETQLPSWFERPASFHVRFRNQPEGQESVLNLQDLEDFYESLTRLIEYIHTERQRRA